MAELHTSAASLRVGGIDLDPDEISRLLGGVPSRSHRKGDLMRNGTAHWNRGLWCLHATDCAPGNVDGQVAEILGQLTADLSVWESLSERFGIDLFCGWFMRESNEGLNISPKTLVALAERKIELAIDIYAPSRRDKDAANS